MGIWKPDNLPFLKSIKLKHIYPQNQQKYSKSLIYRRHNVQNFIKSTGIDYSGEVEG